METASSFCRTGLLLQLLMLTLLHQGSEAQSYGRSPKSFCSGSEINCALFDDGRVKCVGRGGSYGMSINYGSLSNITGDSIPYINIANSQSIEEIYCGGAHLCATLSNGKLKCIGESWNGRLGLGITTSPVGEANGYTGDNLPFVNVGTGLNVTGVTLGAGHSCVVVTGNKVKCFGSNYYEQLGLGDSRDRGFSSSEMGENLPFVDFGTDVEVASIHSGSSAFHSCVILLAPVSDAQRIKCWGSNYWYQLGYGDRIYRGDNLEEMGDNLTLVDLGDESRVKQLALGSTYTCALLLSNTLKCFGASYYGQLGSGSTATISSTGNALPTVLIDSGKTIKFVTAGYEHTCIVYDDMITMKCVGVNWSGLLGQGDTDTRGTTPETMIPNITAIDLGTGSLSISKIYSGFSHNCISFVDLSVRCFGDNEKGQLGRGSTSSVGDQSAEMGSNLQTLQFFSPTKSPTSPTSPTLSPTLPTLSPTELPTKNPSLSPTKRPTSSPTPPTLSPTRSPTRNPTYPPLSGYLPSKNDCYMYATKDDCDNASNAECGKCSFLANQGYYQLLVKVDFVMDKMVPYSTFEVAPTIKTFRDAFKALLSDKLNGFDKIQVSTAGNYYQDMLTGIGYAQYVLKFIGKDDANRKATIDYFTSQPSTKNYLDDLNNALNKKVGTTGITYITGVFTINKGGLIQGSTEKGICGCPSDVSSSGESIYHHFLTTSMLFMFGTLAMSLTIITI